MKHLPVVAEEIRKSARKDTRRRRNIDGDILRLSPTGPGGK